LETPREQNVISARVETLAIFALQLPGGKMLGIHVFLNGDGVAIGN
jgi:hypothetical protein